MASASSLSPTSQMAALPLQSLVSRDVHHVSDWRTSSLVSCCEGSFFLRMHKGGRASVSLRSSVCVNVRAAGPPSFLSAQGKRVFDHLSHIAKSLVLSNEGGSSSTRVHAATSSSMNQGGTSESHGGGGVMRENEIFDDMFAVNDPWSERLFPDSPLTEWHANSAWEVLRRDVLYLDYRARRDAYSIKAAHDKVVEALNPVMRERSSISSLRQQLEQLQDELHNAHAQVHLSEARVEHTLQRLADMEAAVKGQLVCAEARKCAGATAMAPVTLQSRSSSSAPVTASAAPLTKTRGSNVVVTETATEEKVVMKRGLLNVSGPTAVYSERLRNYWYPVAFTRDVDEKTLVPFDCFDEPWVLFRGADGRPGCVKDECAHRACPLSLGTVVNGRIQCPYHGWEFSTSGECEVMPSTQRNGEVAVKSLPCVEHDGMIWIWPGSDIPTSSMPHLSPPKSFIIHAEIVIELPVEHGLLVENLLDLAHAPFTHTTTFAKGWAVPSLVRFKTGAAAVLRGHWDPYPIDMEFRPPCVVLSTIGLAKPGKLEGGESADKCPKHLFQMHVCLPSSRGKTRLLYRMGLDFAAWAKYVPFIDRLWKHLANQVLAEDLRLVLGQQDRMTKGANVWNHPVVYDKLGIRYRRWRMGLEEDAHQQQQQQQQQRP
eukprot:TRINITY_DN612_c0_g1_i1.p1 TRINITY_DN612_c0_g1~~TRINITY_DN612_c0_g1_i1.p1  ORF type:complete len:656 (-),score=186.37 TRINITY_DN612_c0_g1_i1:47-2014(-)